MNGTKPTSRAIAQAIAGRLAGAGNFYLTKPKEDEKLLYAVYLSARHQSYSSKEYRTKISAKRLDYIAGMRLRHDHLIVNPEFLLNYSKDFGDYAYRILGYSLLAGYSFDRIIVKVGFSYENWYPLSVDLYSLEEAENISCDKLLLEVEYRF